MEVLNAPQQLHKAPPGIPLIVTASLQKRVQQLASSEQLRYEVHLSSIMEKVNALQHGCLRSSCMPCRQVAMVERNI